MKIRPGMMKKQFEINTVCITVMLISNKEIYYLFIIFNYLFQNILKLCFKVCFLLLIEKETLEMHLGSLDKKRSN